MSQVAIWAGEDTENDFTFPGDHLKHRFLDLTQVAIWTVHEVENEFAVQVDHLKHRFLELTKD